MLICYTHCATVFQCNALQCIGFGQFVPHQQLRIAVAVSHMIAGAAVLFQRTPRVANRLLFGRKEALVVHVGDDLVELRARGENTTYLE